MKCPDRLGSAILALVVFATYLFSLAPGVSLWDAPEFVMAGALLDVGHPPGAPFFWLLLRLATSIAPSAHAALACNVVAALCMTAAAITLGLVARELLLWVRPDSDSWCRLAVQSSATLSFAFLQSVWTLAIEVEVYGCAVFLGLAPLWLALRWRRVGDCRLLAVASLLVGLASGVHWLAWLSLPAVGFVIGHALRAGRKAWFPVVGALAGVVVLLLLFWLASGHALDFGALLDVLCVNVFGLPLGSGLVAGALIVLVSLAGCVFWGRGSLVSFSAACCLLVVVGFLPSVVPILRARQGVAIGVGAPRDAQSLADYMAREQYGHRALFRGPSYASPVSDVVYEPQYFYDEAARRYALRLEPVDYVYPDSTLTLFPRMQSFDDAAFWAYSRWVPGLSPAVPSFSDNLSFFFRYQLGHMFVRYVMWNFCGRQNDLSADGGYERGNVLTGLSFLDGPRSLAPVRSGRVVLFCLPMLLALAGLVVLCHRSLWRVAAVVGLLALFAGPALVFFLNMPPAEPRERDYVFVLFYAALCLALSVAVGRFARLLSAYALHAWIPVASGAMPLLLAVAAFSAVSRAGDRFTDSFARSLLSMCPPDAILLVGGDNDTYPLWYAQQIHGLRRDVRIVNYSLLASPWHAQMLLRAGRADAPLVSPTACQVAQGASLTMLLTTDSTALTPAPLRAARLLQSDGLSRYSFFPSRALLLSLADTAVVISPSADALSTQEVVLLELLSHNPDRPLCALADVAPLESLGLSRFFWRLGPMQYFATDTSAVAPLHRWALADLSFDLPDATVRPLSADEAEVAARLHVREMCNVVAAEALARADAVGARSLLLRSLCWYPTSADASDVALVTTARLLVAAGEAHMARAVLCDLADHLAASLSLAAEVATDDPLSAQILLSRQTDMLDALLPALRETGNQDVAVGLEDLLHSIVEE